MTVFGTNPESPRSVDECKRQCVDALLATGRARLDFTTLAEPYVAVVFHALYFLLARRGLSFLRNSAMAVISECVSNAYKANLKRAHFAALGLDIHTSEDYERGMATFPDTLAEPEQCDARLRHNGPGLSITLEIINVDDIQITISSAGDITEAERGKIKEKWERAERMTSFIAELEQARAGAEGAGLGILLSFSLLRESGIGTKNFHFDLGGSTCSSRLIIPTDIRHYSHKLEERGQFATESPAFLPPAQGTPAALHELLARNAAPAEYRSLIETDPGLALAVLTTAQTHTGSRFLSLAAAARALEDSHPDRLTLLYRNFAELEANQDSSPVSTAPGYAATVRGARMARELAQRSCNDTTADVAGTAALLRNIGYGFLRRLADRSATDWRRHQSAELQIGISAPECSARLAEHRNLAPELVQALRYYEIPSALEDIPELVHVVHLADTFVKRELAPNDHPCIYSDLRTLEYFGLDGEADLARLHAQMQAALETKD